jgi:hypothetical protein
VRKRGILNTTSDSALVDFQGFKLSRYETLGDNLSQPIAFVVNDFDGSDVATWNKGRHTFTIGGDILHLSFSPHQHCEERRVHLQRQIHFASHFQKNKGFMLGWVLLGTG